MLKFFANHEVDALVFAQDILPINYEIDPPIVESVPFDNDAQFLDINEVSEGNEVVKDDEVAYNAFMEREDIESNEFEDDDSGRSNAGNISESTDKSEDSNNEVRNENDSDDNLLMDDDEEVLIERKHPSHVNVEDQRPYFSLGMTFVNPTEVRESIRLCYF